MKNFCSVLLAVVFLGGLSACTERTPGEIHLVGIQAALPTMEHIALNANRCWFKSRDRNFKAYHLAPELQSFSGRPRILIVPANNPGNRPLLVIEGTGNPARIAAYGPLMQTKTGKRVGNNLKRWVKGKKNC